MPDTMQAIIRSLLAPCLSQPPTARFRYLKSYLRHFFNGSLSFISTIYTITELCPDFFRTA
jgi:hypothetical protein